MKMKSTYEKPSEKKKRVQTENMKRMAEWENAPAPSSNTFAINLRYGLRSAWDLNVLVFDPGTKGAW